MGLLSVGTLLTWEENKKYAQLIREKGIKQFLNVYNLVKTRTNDCLKWGDEVEFTLVKFDHKAKKAYLLLKADELLPTLNGPEERNEKNLPSLWRPEYANYMVEGTPGLPYNHSIANFNKLESNMSFRRKQVQDMLGEDEYVLSLTNFPFLGRPNYTFPNYPVRPKDGITRSLFFVDEAIFLAHPRFQTLSKNIRQRRNRKVAINVPVFVDEKTPRPFVEDLNQYGDEPESETESKLAAKPDHIYMDAMGFGMGCCCLQMTFQAQSINEAKHLYDQLAPLTPILLALSASSPIWRGYLSDVDCRWDIISASCDDRTREELGEIPLQHDRFKIPKSRYASIDCYISEENQKYNDVPLVKDESIYNTLRENGIDSALANHIAHLFIRDPLVLYKEKINSDDTTETDHFENIQSTNWQTMRFKPPPFNSSIGWRVEFRPTELQMTDFENAALTTFIVLLTRAILSFNLDMIIPISQLEENMKTAQKRDACLQQEFFFRKNIFTDDKECENNECKSAKMSINEIVNGSAEFPGLIQIIDDYLNNLEIDVETQCTIKQYLYLIESRANGKLMTPAAWMRKFVMQHPKYQHDSNLTDEINYDLMWRIYLISSGQIKCPELLHPLKNRTPQ